MKSVFRGKIIGVVGVIICVYFIYRYINKESLIGVIRSDLPPREAGLLSGMLLGDKSGFEKDFYQNLKNSGLVHLVVVSGSNVMLLVGGLIEQLARFWGRKKTIVAGLILGWSYTAMVGWEIPVVRAMLMLSILYWAQILGRKYDPVRGLILAVFIMVGGEMNVLLSVSFWLSIMAFIGVMTSRNHKTSKTNFYGLANVLPRWRPIKIIFEILKPFVDTFGETLWVSLWITPIMALVFGRISWWAPLTNMLVLGITEVITGVGMVGAVIGLILPLGGQLILWLIYPLLKYLAWVAEWGGRSEGVGLVKFNWWIMVGWYLILGYGLSKLSKKSE